MRNKNSKGAQNCQFQTKVTFNHNLILYDASWTLYEVVWYTACGIYFLHFCLPCIGYLYSHTVR